MVFVKKIKKKIFGVFVGDVSDHDSGSAIDLDSGEIDGEGVDLGIILSIITIELLIKLSLGKIHSRR